LAMGSTLAAHLVAFVPELQPNIAQVGVGKHLATGAQGNGAQAIW